MKQGLVGLVAGAVITAAGVLGFNSYNSPEKVKGREMDKIVASLYVSRKTCSYKLENGTKVSFREGFNTRRCFYLETTVGNKINFISSEWLCFSNLFDWAGGDARVLRELELNIDDKWVSYSKDEIRDYASWQNTYEDIIRRAADARVKNLEMEENVAIDSKKREIEYQENILKDLQSKLGNSN